MSWEPLGNGNINDTYLACYHTRHGVKLEFVHQRLNQKVFKDPSIVLGNMRVVTDHIHDRARDLWEAAGEPFYALRLVPTRTGAEFARDADGQVWRTTNYLSGLTTRDTLQSSADAFQVGKCLAEFHWLVSDLDPGLLGDSLPGFHHTEKYYERFLQAVAGERGQRLLLAEPNTRDLIESLQARAELAEVFVSLLRDPHVPMRTVHNDPKINNFMVEPESGRAVCMIDLDTVKAGLLHYDFGDCVRSAANRGGEESRDFGAIGIDLDIFSGLAQGYCALGGSFLKPRERETLVDAVKVLAFELSVRFLTSYLFGDSYFKERYEGNNLNRSRVQFLLLRDIEDQEQVMRRIVDSALAAPIRLSGRARFIQEAGWL